MANTLFQTALYPGSLRAVALRKLLRKCPASWLGVSYKTLIETSVVDRPQYGYCMYAAAVLAKSLGHKSISALEFGVAGGNGLVSIERHANEITRELGIQFEIYGFDGGQGLPAPKDYRDLPHLWQPGFYKMDEDALRKRLKISKLVIGSVSDTCERFLAQYKPAPIGSIFWDLDFYSSTMDAFKILDGAPSYFLPRIWTYFDDIIGEEHSDFTGERLAIADFNARSRNAKITQDHYLRYQALPQQWKYQIFTYHDFDHPDYCKFVGPQNQQKPLV